MHRRGMNGRTRIYVLRSPGKKINKKHTHTHKNSTSVVHLQLCHLPHFFNIAAPLTRLPTTATSFVLLSFGSSTSCRSHGADWTVSFRGQIIQRALHCSLFMNEAIFLSPRLVSRLWLHVVTKPPQWSPLKSPHSY